MESGKECNIKDKEDFIGDSKELFSIFSLKTFKSYRNNYLDHLFISHVYFLG